MDYEEHHSLPLLVQVSLKRKYVDKVDPGQVGLTHVMDGEEHYSLALLLQVSLKRKYVDKVTQDR